MSSAVDRYRQFLRRRRYPVWSVRSTVVYLTMVIGTACLVAGFTDLAIFVRMELALSICALALFWFMALGLYRGARLKKNDLPDVKGYQPSFSAGDAQDSAAEIGTYIDIPIDADIGCLGIVVAFVLWLVLLLFGGLVFWLLAQLGGWVILGFLFGLCWVVYRALRQVFAHSRQCRGKLLNSLSWAMIYTALYTSWLYALLLLGSWMTTRPH